MSCRQKSVGTTRIAVIHMGDCHEIVPMCINILLSLRSTTSGRVTVRARYRTTPQNTQQPFDPSQKRCKTHSCKVNDSNAGKMSAFSDPRVDVCNAPMRTCVPRTSPHPTYHTYSSRHKCSRRPRPLLMENCNAAVQPSECITRRIMSANAGSRPCHALHFALVCVVR